MQIVAQGAQDRYLTKDPEITFFKSMHRRHTNFAIESIEQTINGSVSPSNKVSATISRNGDLVHQVWLEIKIPEVRGDVDDDAAAGSPTRKDPPVIVAEDIYAMIDNITVEIGGTRVDRHYGQWMKAYNSITVSDNKSGILERMTNVINVFDSTSKIRPEQLLRVPLSFWFCKDAGQALPLIALQYHEVKINVHFSKLLPTGSQSTLFVDYIYLDTD